MNFDFPSALLFIGLGLFMASAIVGTRPSTLTREPNPALFWLLFAAATGVVALAMGLHQ